MNLIVLKLRIVIMITIGFFVLIFLSCQSTEKFKFVRGVKSLYKSEYRDSLNNLIFSEIVEIIGTEEKTHFSEKQEKIFYSFNYSSEDSAKFVKEPRLYKTFTYSKSWQRTFSQGIIHNEERLWMHPFRANQYRFTQDSPFPEVRFPLEKNKEWQGGLRSGTDFKTNVITNYKVVGKGKYKNDIGLIKNCWFIHSTSNFKGIINKLNMIYHERLGFVMFEYILHNGDSIRIEMISEREEVSELDYEKYEQRDE